MSASRSWSRQLRAGVLTAVAVGLAAWLERLIAHSAVAQLSLTPSALVIALAVRLGGLRVGLFALFLSAFSIDAFVLTPGGLFNFPQAADAVVYGGFLAAWLAFCVAAEGLHRRFRRETERRATAERVAWQSDRIAELTGALSHARTQSAAIEAALQEPLHALGAEGGAILLLNTDGTTAQVARAVGYPALAAIGSVSLGVRSPLSDAASRGATVFVKGPSAARDQASTEAFPGAAKVVASVTVPLLIGSRVVALAYFGFPEAREFSQADREYLDVLAVRGAQALDRTWQYEDALRARAEAETQRARADQEIVEREKVELALRASEARGRALAARTTRLHALTAALSEAVTLDAVARAVVHQGRIAAGAMGAEVILLTGDRTRFRTLFAEGESLHPVGSETEADPELCSTAAVQSGQPVFVSSFEEWQDRYPKAASKAADGGYISSATLPLLVEGAPIGVLAFYFTAPLNFDHDYRAMLVSVAQHGAQALDRARLYESAQQARAEAEAANRVKDEFVSIVSHELRTPLNAILGWAAVLRRATADPALSQRALQAMEDNAQRQAKLIEELLDFSRITSGRLALTRETVDLRELLRGVVETIIPQAASKRVSLDLSPVPVIHLRGDASRLEQVFFNLLGNALKFTPAEGRISVTVESESDAVAIKVTDSGVGIDPQVLPFIFDRFRQGEEAARRDYGGLGLGLSIAQQLVEAHGGTIVAESAGRGQGATFTVRLPLRGAVPAGAGAGADRPVSPSQTVPT